MSGGGSCVGPTGDVTSKGQVLADQCSAKRIMDRLVVDLLDHPGRSAWGGNSLALRSSQFKGRASTVQAWGLGIGDINVGYWVLCLVPLFFSCRPQPWDALNTGASWNPVEKWVVVSLGGSWGGCTTWSRSPQVQVETIGVHNVRTTTGSLNCQRVIGPVVVVVVEGESQVPPVCLVDWDTEVGISDVWGDEIVVRSDGQT